MIEPGFHERRRIERRAERAYRIKVALLCLALGFLAAALFGVFVSAPLWTIALDGFAAAALILGASQIR